MSIFGNTFDMDNTFYIVKVQDKDWYRLHLSATHYCLGSGEDLTPLLKTVERLSLKYKSERSLLSALSLMEDKGRVPEKTLRSYEQDYENTAEDYEDLIKEVMDKVKDTIKKSSPIYRNFINRKRKLIHHT